MARVMLQVEVDGTMFIYEKESAPDGGLDTYDQDALKAIDMMLNAHARLTNAVSAGMSPRVRATGKVNPDAESRGIDQVEYDIGPYS